MKQITRKQFFKQALAGIAGLTAVALGKGESPKDVVTKLTIADEPLFGDPTLKEWKDLTLEEHQEWFNKAMRFNPNGDLSLAQSIDPIMNEKYGRKPL